MGRAALQRWLRVVFLLLAAHATTASHGHKLLLPTRTDASRHGTAAGTHRLLQEGSRGESARDVLAVAMLITVPQSASKDRLAQARAALRLLAAHLLPTTPSKM